MISRRFRCQRGSFNNSEYSTTSLLKATSEPENESFDAITCGLLAGLKGEFHVKRRRPNSYHPTRPRASPFSQLCQPPRHNRLGQLFRAPSGLLKLSEHLLGNLGLTPDQQECGHIHLIGGKPMGALETLPAPADCSILGAGVADLGLAGAFGAVHSVTVALRSFSSLVSTQMRECPSRNAWQMTDSLGRLPVSATKL